jgi:hypothetical protein
VDEFSNKVFSNPISTFLNKSTPSRRPVNPPKYQSLGLYVKAWNRGLYSKVLVRGHVQISWPVKYGLGPLPVQ